MAWNANQEAEIEGWHAAAGKHARARPDSVLPRAIWIFLVWCWWWEGLAGLSGMVLPHTEVKIG